MSSSIIGIIGAAVILTFPPAESDIMFDHSSHFVDRDIACASCHSAPSSIMSSDKNIPGHENCADCHTMENAPEDCALCHADPNEPIGVTLPEREIIFSHAAHVKPTAGADLCLSCHKDVPTGKFAYRVLSKAGSVSGLIPKTDEEHQKLIGRALYLAANVEVFGAIIFFSAVILLGLYVFLRRKKKTKA